jgi:hypothetical protein
LRNDNRKQHCYHCKQNFDGGVGFHGRSCEVLIDFR